MEIESLYIYVEKIESERAGSTDEAETYAYTPTPDIHTGAQ